MGLDWAVLRERMCTYVGVAKWESKAEHPLQSSEGNQREGGGTNNGEQAKRKEGGKGGGHKLSASFRKVEEEYVARHDYRAGTGRESASSSARPSSSSPFASHFH